jgi:hypothetical protein
MGKHIQHHGNVSSSAFYRDDSPIGISVLTSVRGPDKAEKPCVSLHIATGEIAIGLSVHPAAARELAALLIEAADAADRPEAGGGEDEIEHARRAA